MDSGKTRIVYLDAARSVLMGLGVLLHGAAIYDSMQAWKINDSDPASGYVFHYLREAIHAFRMEGFFMISGLFTLMHLRRQGNRFLRVRLPRIIIPLISTALLLNTLQAYVLYRHGGGQDEFWRCYWGNGLADFVLSARWLSHLWFLGYLTAYTLIAYWIYRAWLKYGFPDTQLEQMCRLIASPIGIFVLPGIVLALWAPAYKLGGLLTGGAIDLGNLTYLGCFFALGIFMHYAAAVMEAMTRANAAVVCAIPVALMGLWLEDAFVSGWRLTFLDKYLHILLSYSLSILVLNLFRRFASKPNRFFRYFSEASYSVYLFHHLTVIAIGIVLMETTLATYTKYAIVVVVAFATTLAIHHFVVLRIPLIRYLFNGKPPAPRQERPEPEAA